jgi:hypothetical protein
MDSPPRSSCNFFSSLKPKWIIKNIIKILIPFRPPLSWNHIPLSLVLVGPATNDVFY